MSDPTGYRESSDTTDGPVAESQAGAGASDPEGDGDAGTLTTDEDAQSDDGVVRPGNAAD